MKNYAFATCDLDMPIWACSDFFIGRDTLLSSMTFNTTELNIYMRIRECYVKNSSQAYGLEVVAQWFGG